MVVNPITITPERTLADALALMDRHRISGIPVVSRREGKLVGILTNRDVRYANDPNQPVRSEEHTSELQSLMRNSYAVFCLKKKTRYIQARKTTKREPT